MLLERVAQDVRFAIRTLRKSPTFTLAVIATLALTTGATAAIFSVVNSVLLRPLPYPNAEQLVEVTETGRVGGPGPVFAADLEAFRRDGTTFQGFTTHSLTTKQVERPAGPVRLAAVITDLEFFRVLGTPPLIGRTFDPANSERAVVLSARAWAEHFSRDESIVGSTITLAGQMFDPQLQRAVIDRSPFRVLGVMPEAFQFPYGAASTLTAALPESRTDIWVYDERQSRGGRAYVTGRLKAGVTLRQGASELVVIKERIDAAAPAVNNRPVSVNVRSLSDAVLAPIRSSLWLLAIAVTLVLTVACVNIANLLVARTSRRQQEFATRIAVGATHAQLIRQSFTESLLLALVGGALGSVVGWWGLQLLMVRAAPKIPRAHEVAFAWEAFALLLLLCMITAVLFGLAPAIAAARTNVRRLSDAGVRTTASSGLVRLRDGLIVVEIAVAFVLAAAAAGVIRQLQQLNAADPGITTENVVTIHMTPRAEDEHYFRIEQRVRQLPGVAAAGFIQLVPLQNWGWVGTFHVSGRAPDAERPIIELRTVTPGYFEALGIPILAGRNLTEHDRTAKPRAIIINEALARQHFHDQDPIGKATDRGIIVGMIRDVRQAGLDRPVVPEVYDTLGPSAGIAADIGMSLVVRTAGAPQAILSDVRQVVRETNPQLAIFNVRTMEQIVADSLWELNLYRWLIGLFAALALLLATVGLYAVINYNVLMRTRELAVRLAMGSAPADLARSIVTRGAMLASGGIVLGAVFSLPLTRAVAEHSALQPRVATTMLVAVVVLGIAVIASAVPAFRTTRIDPAAALRQD